MGLVSRPFQGKMLSSPITTTLLPAHPATGPLQLLTILLSICKSFSAENCHPERDSGGWWRLQAGLGCPSPLSSKAALHRRPPLSRLSGQPRKPEAVLTCLAEPSGAGRGS